MQVLFKGFVFSENLEESFRIRGAGRVEGGQEEVQAEAGSDTKAPRDGEKVLSRI